MTPDDSARNDESGGYVHRPGGPDEDGADDEFRHPAEADREFDWRGWTLVAVLFVALVVAPVGVYLRPPALPWYVTLVVLPLVPAFLLGAVAVWATTRP